ncbi:MAG TPA: FAD-binding oxidoreductase [bacterium]|nr:FAD-binding oxidoreductase [bacterium]
MGPVKVAALSGGATEVPSEAVTQLRARLRGALLQSGDPGYDDARALWNAMIDRRPALVAQCAGAADVAAVVAFVREHNLLLAIKGGGHNIAGNAVCDGGVLVEFSRMRTVEIDAKAKVARVGPGATLGDFDQAAQKHGLATPLGINSTTGVAGLTLGGGFGWLSRRFGMTIDNLLACEVVLADGRVVTASEKENADLFWALRGGGGNFGIVTRFEFRLHPVGPEILAGLFVFPLSDARSALKKYREYIQSLGDETTVWVVMRKAPPLPFLPASAHGTEVIVFPVFHSGDPDAGRRAIEPVRHFGALLGEAVGMQPYTGWQSAFDPLLTPGARNYWKSHNLAELKDGLIDLLIDYIGKLPSDQCEIFLGGIGAATTRPARDAMAYSQRDTVYAMNVHSRWDNPADDQKCVQWARDFCQKTEPYATGGVYVNFLTADEMSRVRAAYGPNYDRLVAAKQKYDPGNLFRMNMNIAPAR